jgi:hypothetical protein
VLTASIEVNGRRVALINIRNDGTGARGGYPCAGIGHYNVELWLEPGVLEGRARVEGWDRSRPAHELVRQALEAIRGDREAQLVEDLAASAMQWRAARDLWYSYEPTGPRDVRALELHDAANLLQATVLRLAGEIAKLRGGRRA